MIDECICKLTKAASETIKKIMSEENLEKKETYLRIQAANMGCSGIQYSLDFTNSIDKEADQVFKQDGINVAVDDISARYLEGTVIDYIDNAEDSGFKFENPNTGGCDGCTSC